MAGEVMSEERLAEIKARWRWNSVDALPTGSQAKMDMRALYDEVKRARAREVALVAEVERQRGVLEALARAIRFERELKQQEGERHGAD